MVETQAVETTTFHDISVYQAPVGLDTPDEHGHSTNGLLLKQDETPGATLQAAIAPEMQGRVFAFILSAAMLVSPLALIIAGPVADAVGIQLWFLIAGISCILMGTFGCFSSDVMTMENRSNEEAGHALTEPS